MGLDMYLSAKLSISGYQFDTEAERSLYHAIVDTSGLRAVADPGAPYGEVKVDVACWRKANAIHRWFVDNVQYGDDDCREYAVDREQLEELRDTCREVLRVAKISDGQPVHNGTSFRPGQEPEEHFMMGRAILNGEEVAAILPTTDGFFFGSTDYDEFYLQDVEGTIRMIDRVLAGLPEQASLSYHSSW
jgi:hypothetical protein